jgi:hypothetical protein
LPEAHKDLEERNHFMNPKSSSHPRAEGSFYHEPHYQEGKPWLVKGWVKKYLDGTLNMIQLQNTLIEMGNNWLPVLEDSFKTEVGNNEPADHSIFCAECKCNLADNPTHRGCNAIRWNKLTQDWEPRSSGLEKLHDFYCSNSQVELLDDRSYTPGHRLLRDIVCTLIYDSNWTKATRRPSAWKLKGNFMVLHDRVKDQAADFRAKRHTHYWPVPLALGGFDGTRLFAAGINFCFFPLPAVLYKDLDRDIEALASRSLDYPHYCLKNWYWNIDSKMPDHETSAVLKDTHECPLFQEIGGPTDEDGIPVRNPLHVHLTQTHAVEFDLNGDPDTDIVPETRTFFELPSARPQVCNHYMAQVIYGRCLNRAIQKHKQPYTLMPRWTTVQMDNNIYLDNIQRSICKELERSDHTGCMGIYMHLPIDYGRVLHIPDHQHHDYDTGCATDNEILRLAGSLCIHLMPVDAYPMLDVPDILQLNPFSEYPRIIDRARALGNKLLPVMVHKIGHFFTEENESINSMVMLMTLVAMSCIASGSTQLELEQTRTGRHPQSLQPWHFDFDLDMKQFLSKYCYHKATHEINKDMWQWQDLVKMLPLSESRKTANLKRKTINKDVQDVLNLSSSSSKSSASRIRCLHCSGRLHKPFHVNDKVKCNCVVEQFVPGNKKIKKEVNEMELYWQIQHKDALE